MIFQILNYIGILYIICKVLKKVYPLFFGPHDCLWYGSSFRFGCPHCKSKWTWYGKRK